MRMQSTEPHRRSARNKPHIEGSIADPKHTCSPLRCAGRSQVALLRSRPKPCWAPPGSAARCPLPAALPSEPEPSPLSSQALRRGKPCTASPSRPRAAPPRPARRVPHSHAVCPAAAASSAPTGQGRPFCDPRPPLPSGPCRRHAPPRPAGQRGGAAP